MAEKPNGVYAGEEEGEEERDQEESFKQRRKGSCKGRDTLTLWEVLNRFVNEILFPEPANSGSLLSRIKISVSENAPLFPEASRNTARDLLLWTRRGSPLRAILVISVGTITFVALTGLIVFMLFFLAATTNAVVVSLLMSLAAAGGFLALFFAFVTAIYVAALSVAVFAISITTFWAIVAILITTGWIGFFYIVWLATKKSFGFAKHSLSVTGSAISTYTAGRHARHLLHRDPD